MLKDKVALVTGASQGIGKEIALTLAGQGATVVINYNNSKEKALDVLNEIESNKGKAIIYKADVSDFDSVKQMMNDVKKEFKRIDILVNNAGITKDNLVLRMSEADFDDVIKVNLKGSYNCMKHISPIMIRQRYGRIINVSSLVGVRGNVGQVNYSASKAGLIGMTKSLAKEIGSRGITVNAVAPGFIETEMTKELKEEWKEKIMEEIPLKKLGQAKDVAQLVAFLASDYASYITGEVIRIDGGLGA